MVKFIALIKSGRNISRLLSLFLIFISVISAANCFDISITPGSICCGDCITVTISLTNTGGSIFNGHIDIYIIDAAGIQNRMNGLDITLQPHESNAFPTRICPSKCNSYGTYQVVVKVLDANGKEAGTKTSTFIVKDPASCPKTPGCTWTFTCDNNVVKRLCVDQNGKEYWKIYDDCNSYNPPKSCINGVCVDTTPPLCNQQTCPPPGECINGECIKVCDPQQCQSQNGPIGPPFVRDDTVFRRYKECSCDAYTKSCPCNQVEIKCTGTVSGYIYDADTNKPIKKAIVLMSQNNYLPPTLTNEIGYFSFRDISCPTTSTTITCTSEGYDTLTRPYLQTDANGDLSQNYYLHKSQTPTNNNPSDTVEIPLKLIMRLTEELGKEKVEYYLYMADARGPSAGWVLLQSGEVFCDKYRDDYEVQCKIFDEISKPSDTFLNLLGLKDSLENQIKFYSVISTLPDKFVPVVKDYAEAGATLTAAYAVFTKISIPASESTLALVTPVLLPPPLDQLLKTNDQNFMDTNNWDRVQA